MGLAPVVVELIFETIETLNKSGITILLVEQNAAMALSIADRGYVLETGHVALKGPGKDAAQRAGAQDLPRRVVGPRDPRMHAKGAGRPAPFALPGACGHVPVLALASER